MTHKKHQNNTLCDHNFHIWLVTFAAVSVCSHSLKRLQNTVKSKSPKKHHSPFIDHLLSKMINCLSLGFFSPLAVLGRATRRCWQPRDHLILIEKRYINQQPQKSTWLVCAHLHNAKHRVISWTTSLTDSSQWRLCGKNNSNSDVLIHSCGPLRGRHVVFAFPPCVGAMLMNNLSGNKRLMIWLAGTVQYAGGCTE